LQAVQLVGHSGFSASDGGTHALKTAMVWHFHTKSGDLRICDSGGCE